MDNSAKRSKPKGVFQLHGIKCEIPSDESWRDKPWTLECRPGGWLILTRGPERRRVKFAFAQSGVKSRLSAALGGAIFSGDWLKRATSAGAAGSDASADFLAQFPGKVRKVLVQVGVQTEKGTPLLLLEAMKMEFPVVAPGKGVVKAILVKEGEQLSPGIKLLEWEAAKG